MRINLAKDLLTLGGLTVLTFVGSGCQPSSDVQLNDKSSSSGLHTTRTSPSLLPSPALTESGKDHTSHWLLKPGLLNLEQGVWLGWIGLAFGLLGTGFSIHCSRKNSRLMLRLNDHRNRQTQLDADVAKAHTIINQLKNTVNDSSTKLGQLQVSYQQLEEKQASVSVSLSSQHIQQRPELDPISFRLNSTVEAPLPSQMYIKSPEQKLAEITTAVNRGDRQVIRGTIRAQLNITNDSENAISMGRLNETQLEEVTAGGSYWIVSIGSENWLYPTEQTLKGYSQSQRPTGIFTYIRQPISSAQVVSPARLSLNGPLWSVAEPGSIAVPA